MKNCFYTKVFKFFVSKVIRVQCRCRHKRDIATRALEAQSLDLQTAHAQATPMPPRNEHAVAAARQQQQQQQEEDSKKFE
jgi:hypothetical protein